MKCLPLSFVNDTCGYLVLTSLLSVVALKMPTKKIRLYVFIMHYTILALNEWIDTSSNSNFHHSRILQPCAQMAITPSMVTRRSNQHPLVNVANLNRIKRQLYTASFQTSSFREVILYLEMGAGGNRYIMAKNSKMNVQVY